MKRLFQILTFLVLLFPFTSVSARSLEDKLKEAENLYNSSKFEEAVASYDSIVANHGESFSLLFNLGSSYYRLGDNGKAMLYYMKAKRINPYNKQLNNNIKFISGKILDANMAEAKNDKEKLMPDNKSFFTSLGETLFLNISSNTWAVIAAVAFILLLCGVALYVFTSNILSRKIGFFSTIILFVVVVITISFSFVAASKSESFKQGVVVSFKTTLKQAPDNNSKDVVTPLNKGTVLEVMKTENDEKQKNTWYKVKLNNNIIGWIDSDNFQII